MKKLKKLAETNKLTVLVFVFLLSIMGCDTHRRALIKQGKIPSNAKYTGGIDGGVYVFISVPNDSLVEISFYNDWTGDRGTVFTYHLKKQYRNNFNVNELYKKISTSTGVSIVWRDYKLPECLEEIKPIGVGQ